MSGLDIFGAIGVSVQLTKVASSCLSTVLEIRRIPDLTREQNDAQFNLLVQAFRYEQWCSAIHQAGKSNSSSSQSQSPAAIFTGMKSLQVLLLDDQMAGALTRSLKDMNDRFASVRVSLEKYGPKSEAESTPVTGGQDYLEPPKSSFFRRVRFGSKATPSPTPTSRPPSVLSRSMWVVSERASVDKDLAQIEKTNKLLLHLLDPILQAHVERQTDLAILSRTGREVLAGKETRRDLQSMARIKQWQKQAANETASNEDDGANSIRSSVSGVSAYQDQYTGRVQTFQIADFERGSLPQSEYRTVTMLNGRRVVVEWKYYSSERTIRVDQILRLGRLGDLLNKNRLHAQFMTMRCHGLVDDAENSRIGIAFSEEESEQVAQVSTQRLRTLQEVVEKETMPLPLGQRFELARKLAAAVHHLHSVDWLHKSIRSDNVVCFWESVPPTRVPKPNPASIPEEDGANAATAPSAEVTEVRPRRVVPFYLVGWDLSRPDHPSELTETLSISTSDFKKKERNIEMYSHPRLHVQSGQAKRTRHRAEFDIYSLGLVLLEIGLWRPLDDFRQRCKDDAEFRAKIAGEYCDRLRPKVGDIYCRAVRRCLRNDFGVIDQPEHDDGQELLLQVAFERLVVSELERCRA